MRDCSFEVLLPGMVSMTQFRYQSEKTGGESEENELHGDPPWGRGNYSSPERTSPEARINFLEAKSDFGTDSCGLRSELHQRLCENTYVRDEKALWIVRNRRTDPVREVVIEFA